MTKWQYSVNKKGISRKRARSGELPIPSDPRSSQTASRGGPSRDLQFPPIPGIPRDASGPPIPIPGFGGILPASSGPGGRIPGIPIGSGGSPLVGSGPAAQIPTAALLGFATRPPIRSGPRSQMPPFMGPSSRHPTESLIPGPSRYPNGFMGSGAMIDVSSRGSKPNSGRQPTTGANAGPPSAGGSRNHEVPGSSRERTMPPEKVPSQRSKGGSATFVGPAEPAGEEESDSEIGDMARTHVEGMVSRRK